MGYEGTAAALSYRVFRTFLKTDGGFQGRKARPATDPVNALLSLGYTLLYNHMFAAINIYNHMFAAINIVGLDPYQGFFHQRKHGHAALASDLIEEWRAILVDSIVLTVLNRREIKLDDFHA
jgi:CRISPR-associated protein Cas1